MSKKFLSILVFLMVVVGVFAALPVSAQSSCTVSTRSSSMRLRAGHSTTDALVGNMPRNVQLQAVERYVESLGGKKTRVWYRLLKEEAAPNSPYEQVWVGGSVKTKGDCVNISTASAAPATTDTGSAPAAAPAASGIVLPQAGAWTWTAGDTLTGSCPGLGEVSIPFIVIYGNQSRDVAIDIAITDGGFTANGVPYTRDGNGTWYGYGYLEGTATVRIDSPTSVLGDLNITSSDGCSLKTPIWGSPR